MSQTLQASSRTTKPQTTLKHKQSKLTHAHRPDELKEEVQCFRTECEKSRSNLTAFSQTEYAGNKAEMSNEIPGILTLPEVKRVEAGKGVTKVVIDLETSSRGRLKSILGIRRFLCIQYTTNNRAILRATDCEIELEYISN